MNSLNSIELKCIFSILPAEKPGYNEYRQKINSMVVISRKEEGGINLILGTNSVNLSPDEPSAPVFAAGTLKHKDGELDVVVHEEIDNTIEIDLSASPALINDDFTVESLSYWNPSGKDEWLREIRFHENYILAISPVQKRIWLHNMQTGVNHIIPVTNYYNQLMLLKQNRDPEFVLRPALLFEHLTNYTDGELISAFILYNKYFRRFQINFESKPAGAARKEKNDFRFFKRG